MAGSTGSGTTRLFDRKLITQGDRKLIESTCRRCGTVIVGSITEGLADVEEKHAQECRGSKRH